MTRGTRPSSARAAPAASTSNTPPLAPGALNNPVSTLQTRIDLVLSRGAARADGDEAELIGDTPFQGTPPFWPSDHAGVVAEVRLNG